ncbi:MAG: phosphoglycerate dehydrogenase [Dehalococcoidales bacterium]|nr:phosphoglycerate dehydrogenase [Dehalococcoidales bacterium]
MSRVLATDGTSAEGVACIKECAQLDIKPALKPEELLAIIGDYEALIVRSSSQVTAQVIEAGKKLMVIGRAGVGIDNIDVNAATQKGIIVVNAPTGNTISAAEHTIGLMMSLARHIPQANASLKGGQWLKSKYTGIEVRNKTLGIIGLGNIGAAVARRAEGLEMKVIAYDPFVTAERAKQLQVTMVSLEELFKKSDFITIHTPLNATTKGIITEKEIALMKPSVRIINCARGGLIDEELLARAITEKKIAGAAIDVFTKEPTTESPLFGKDNIIVTPHLGASTAEAQVTAAKDVAEQIVDVLNGKPARYAVNIPFVAAETFAVLAPFMKTASVAGKLLSQLVEGQIKAIRIKYDGEIANYDTAILKASVLNGLLEAISDERVNLVNANVVANRRGIGVVEEKNATCENYTSLVTLVATSTKGTTTVAATVLRGEAHIVRVNDYWLDIVPSGDYFLFSDHMDRPGIIGAVGNITGSANINIHSMHVSRLKPRGQALMILALDEPLPDKVLNQIQAIPDITSAKLVKI